MRKKVCCHKLCFAFELVKVYFQYIKISEEIKAWEYLHL